MKFRFIEKNKTQPISSLFNESKPTNLLLHTYFSVSYGISTLYVIIEWMGYRRHRKCNYFQEHLLLSQLVNSTIPSTLSSTDLSFCLALTSLCLVRVSLCHAQYSLHYNLVFGKSFYPICHVIWILLFSFPIR